MNKSQVQYMLSKYLPHLINIQSKLASNILRGSSQFSPERAIFCEYSGDRGMVDPLLLSLSSFHTGHSENCREDDYHLKVTELSGTG